MSRVESFKRARRYRAKCIMTLVLFFTLVFAGVCLSDYSVNMIMKNQSKIEIIKLEKKDDSYIMVDFMNLKLYLNTLYVKEDIERLKAGIQSFLGK
ncbi:hypothetical protein DFR58_106142 [Anaerobacterium chartisolvens]|uniref:Uncharacterized protein n=2 Tax=Anaerobacterium chartisolvens TaxID=1297424 RepID=A0A369B8W7_9FIRM|nr:hypothetical protein DFR58_106142 [Anaerobacterium chartisolvens]